MLGIAHLPPERQAKIAKFANLPENTFSIYDSIAAGIIGNKIDYGASLVHNVDLNEIKKDFEGWARAKSPYILKDQSRKSYVYVRAIDKAGNERVEMVKPKKSTSWSEFWWIYVIIITTITFLLLRKKVRA